MSEEKINISRWEIQAVSTDENGRPENLLVYKNRTFDHELNKFLHWVIILFKF